jgi:[acyl-carrier-protein] S-malonyltransferase
LVISGAVDAVNEACIKLKEAGARRALVLPVGGAFHSPLMEPARKELAEAIEVASFATPICPIYQNVDGKPHTSPEEIKANLIAQLTAPVRWTQIVENMVADGISSFVELGPGCVLQGLISKISPMAIVESKANF